MNRSARILGVVAVALALLLAGGVTWAAVATWQAGTIRVSVRDHRPGGTDLAFVLPAVALDAALAVVPDQARAEIELDVEAARVLSMLHAVCAGLEEQDDFVLVDARSASETVRVEKRGGSLLVHVESPDESVRVEIPLSAIARVARWLHTPAPDASSASV